MTYDPTTGLNYAYNYRGQLVAVDDDPSGSPLPSPSTIYSHDVTGRLVLTEHFHDDPITDDPVLTGQEVTICACCVPCGCGSPGAPPAGIETLDASAPTPPTVPPTIPPTTEDISLYLFGVVPFIPTSGGASSAYPAVAPPSGNLPGDVIVAEYDAVAQKWIYLGRDMISSPFVEVDENCDPIFQNDYSDHGEVYMSEVSLFVGSTEYSSVSDGSGNTTINFPGSPFTTDEFIGDEIAIARPSATSDRYLVARVEGNTTNSITVTDAGGTSAPIYLALTEGGDGAGPAFTLFNFNDSATSGDGTHTGGDWTSAPSYSAMNDETTFTDSFANFQSFQVGWYLSPDSAAPNTFTIKSTSTTTLVVAGDLSNLASSGDLYRVHIPKGIDGATGALATIDTNAGTQTWNVNDHGSRWGFAGYRHQPANAGYYDSYTTNTLSAQSGSNLAGTYYAWNRVYDPTFGRWTTPDPAGMPFWNLFDYVKGRATVSSDPSGLAEFMPDTMSWMKNDFFEIHKIPVMSPYPGNALVHWSWKIAFEGTCGAWELVENSEEKFTKVTCGTDINWCCKVWRRECTGHLVLIRTKSWKFNVTVKVISGNDDADVLSFGVELDRGSYEHHRKKVTMWGWKMKCKCKAEEGTCDKILGLCGMIDPPDMSDSAFYMSHSKKYSEITSQGRIGGYLNVNKRPTHLGG
ncbi:MAG: hypothetical protein OEY28_14180, partial [Nitrospira sp.]|nr:hypothetical protein [Nitrospira sp.]